MDSCSGAGMVAGRVGTRTSRHMTTPAKAGVHSVQALRQAQGEREGGPFVAPPPVRGEPVEPCEREGERAYIEARSGMDSCFRRNGCGQGSAVRASPARTW